ncbi:hypothetical protein J6590_096001 [Homalodisca vitripennis]|nr:hypothetical protein J6590_085683 [Homalodisca vitripennis]KAG8314301.1 hypothetical protein J6590_096001 [Homalodisca vitripennis]
MVSYNRPTTKPALLNRAVWLAWVDHSGSCVVSPILIKSILRAQRGLGLPARTELTCKESQVSGSPSREKDTLR